MHTNNETSSVFPSKKADIKGGTLPSVLSLLARFAVLSLYLSQCPTVSALLCCRVPYSLSCCVLLVITVESFEAIGSDTGSGDFTPLDSATSWTFPLGEQEAQLYYAGLPSRPILIARSSITPWTPPPSLEAYAELKELRPVGQHPISATWLPRSMHTFPTRWSSGPALI